MKLSVKDCWKVLTYFNADRFIEAKKRASKIIWKEEKRQYLKKALSHMQKGRTLGSEEDFFSNPKKSLNVFPFLFFKIQNKK